MAGRPTKEELQNRIADLEEAMEDASDALAAGDHFEAEEIIDGALEGAGEDD